VGAFLRLFNLDRALWLFDQTQLLQIARASTERGMIATTGIPSSIGTLTPPISIYLLLPLAAFTSNPLPQTLLLALANVVGVAICYVAALRGFGRRVAAWSALVFAVCPAAVWYSRFLWQQNFIAPLLGLWALTLFAAVQRSGRRWFVAHVLLLLVCILLHPTVAYLLPVTLLALWLSPHRPQWWEYALSGLIVTILLTPTLVWEIASDGYDLHVLQGFVGGQQFYDLHVFKDLLAILGAPNHGLLAPLAAYLSLIPLFNGLTALTALLFGFGWLLLTVRLWREARFHWGDAVSVTGWPRRLWRFAGLLREQERWRINLVLWAWVTLPLVALLRHGAFVYPHYLITLYPGIFLVIGLGATWLVEQGRLLASRLSLRVSGPDRALRFVPTIALVALLAALTVQSTLYAIGPDASAYSATADYGYPLSSMLAAKDRLNATSEREGLPNIDIVASPNPDYHTNLATILKDERVERSVIDGTSCLRLPGTGESLVVAEPTSLPGSELLASLSSARQLDQLPLQGEKPWLVYRVSPVTVALPGGIIASGVRFGDVDQPALRLEAFQRVAPELILLQWTVLTSSASAYQRLSYHVRAIDAEAGVSGDAWCSATQWTAGDTLITWMRVRRPGSGPFQLRVSAEQTDYTVIHALGLTWFADAVRTTSSTTLIPSGGAYTLPSV
jgi:hypothetical protein